MLTDGYEHNGVHFDVRVIPEDAGVISTVSGHGTLGVYSLIGSLGVQNERGYTTSPRISSRILVPEIKIKYIVKTLGNNEMKFKKIKQRNVVNFHNNKCQYMYVCSRYDILANY